MKIVEEIMELFARRGAAAYHGEAVSQAEHALQAAELAEQEGAPDRLSWRRSCTTWGTCSTARTRTSPMRGVDGRHEEAGGAWLARHFGPEVTEPIRLHVAAKRYLCAVDPAYLDGLSPASRLSLDVQGGPMGAEERAEFEANPYYRDAVRLRHWDDTAKVPGLAVPGLEHYRDRLEAAARPGWPLIRPMFIHLRGDSLVASSHPVEPRVFDR